MERAELDQALLKAHQDKDSAALVHFYTLAGDRAEAAGDINAACFYLTHAFVFALEAGLPDARELNRRLAAQDRAHPLEL
ncbi:hypothetical protein [Leisingera sp.]|uniref:hypothetical protein n=1 Tax=Leisingera sp. TaxID=1879318 RepID=UPI002B278F28|nr:hypothetical protein [Leisingera sp.]